MVYDFLNFMIICNEVLTYLFNHFWVSLQLYTYIYTYNNKKKAEIAISIINHMEIMRF